jgi:uncharacterized protein with ATP-grasp and redox domains
MVSEDSAVHERIVREVLLWVGGMTLEEPRALLGQRIRRRLRERTGVDDPYRAAKDHQKQMAKNILLELRTKIEAAPDSLSMVVRLALAGNVIDMGVNGDITEADVRQSIQHALAEPFFGEWGAFCQAAAMAQRILYLADAHAVGLHEMVEIIDNGSNIAGTIPNDCSHDFLKRFSESDVVVAKGQGNFETLSDEPYNIFFLFKAKCSVIAGHVGVPICTNVLARSNVMIAELGGAS